MEVGSNTGLVRSPGFSSALLGQIPPLFARSESAARHFLEFFAAHIRNPNTRRAYLRNVREFAAWCAAQKFDDLLEIEPLHVAAYVESVGTRLSRPSVKQHLAAIRMLFDWLVVRQVIASNPAAPVRGPRHSVRKGKTAVLTADEARELLDSIESDTLIGLRDRALIATMVYTFARIGAVIRMRGEDVYVQGRRTWLRLHEKGGKRHEIPAHHALERYLEEYRLAGTATEGPKAYLFRTVRGRTGRLTDEPLSQPDAYRMIRRRALACGIRTRIGNHSFRATGITEYLRNGGKLEIAQQMAAHESARTTGLYDRRDDELSLDEVERIRI
jgi:site-specific recombinase XerD